MTAPVTAALAEVLDRWRQLSASDRAAFLVIAWRERWPIPESAMPAAEDEPAS